MSSPSLSTIELKIAREKQRDLRTLIKASEKVEVYNDTDDLDYSLVKRLAKKLGTSNFNSLKSKKSTIGHDCRIIEERLGCQLARYSQSSPFCEKHSLVSYFISEMIR